MPLHPLRRLLHRVERVLHDPELPIWYAPQYRLPITGLESQRGLEPRRADLAAWSLLELGAITPRQLHTPHRVRFGDLVRVHSPELLESLMSAEALARVFAVEPWDVPVDEVVHSIRLAVGGTMAATWAALRRKGPAMNLLGGFHHAGPDRVGGLCPVNDIAVAIARLRAEGFTGQVVVLDLDAHPGDGTAACLEHDPRAFIGSISGSDWGPLPGKVMDRFLPGGDDEACLGALEEILAAMPPPDLAFVIAGGDVLKGDRMGMLAMSLEGVRRRDLRVAAALKGRPSVWLPGGGYSSGAWRILAGTGLALALGTDTPIPDRADPLHERFADVARRLDPSRLKGEAGRATSPETEPWITQADLADALGLPGRREHRLLGFYTAAGIEYALYRYGLTDQVRRMGYHDIEVEVDRVAVGDRMRAWGKDGDTRHLLVEGVYEKRELAPPPGIEGPACPVLFVHWLNLRHPRGNFSEDRPRLPGQDAPGLGMAAESGEMLVRMAERLELDGVMLRPAWYHVAYVSRHGFRFIDPARQGRFEALVRDLAHLPLLQATHAVADGKVLLDGKPYAWEADEMVAWRRGPPWKEDLAMVAAVREATRFSV